MFNEAVYNNENTFTRIIIFRYIKFFNLSKYILIYLQFYKICVLIYFCIEI